MTVQSLPGGRDRSSGGWQAETAADLEQDPRQDPDGDRQPGPRGVGPVAA
jgi:hypothetical protein